MAIKCRGKKLTSEMHVADGYLSFFVHTGFYVAV